MKYFPLSVSGRNSSRDRYKRCYNRFPISFGLVCHHSEQPVLENTENQEFIKMSLYKKQDEEVQSILHPEIDPVETSTPRFVYIHNMSKPRLCAVVSLLLIVAALVTIAAVFIVRARASPPASVEEMEGIIVMIGPDGREFDSKVYVNEARQVERLIVPLTGERYGRPIHGTATVVHDFKVGYTAYSLLPDDGEGACYVSQLNKSLIKYTPDALIDFLTEYQNQPIRRTPRFKMSYPAENIKDVSDLSVFMSPDIERTCQGQRSYLLGRWIIILAEWPTTRMGFRRRDLPCISNVFPFGVDVRIACHGREREPEPDYSDYFDYDFANELEEYPF